MNAVTEQSRETTIEAIQIVAGSIEAGKMQRDVGVTAIRKLREKHPDLPAPLISASKGRFTYSQADYARDKAAGVLDRADPHELHKATAANEWDTQPRVRRGFSQKKNYVEFRAAELAGKFGRKSR